MVTQGSSSNLIRSAIVTSRCLYVVRFNIHRLFSQSTLCRTRYPPPFLQHRLEALLQLVQRVPPNYDRTTHLVSRGAVCLIQRLQLNSLPQLLVDTSTRHTKCTGHAEAT